MPRSERAQLKNFGRLFRRENIKNYRARNSDAIISYRLARIRFAAAHGLQALT
jgi:hypothetical protein